MTSAHTDKQDAQRAVTDWRRDLADMLADTLTAGDRALRIKVGEDYQEMMRRDEWGFPIVGANLDCSDRIAASQAYYLRAIAVGLAHSTTETAELVATVKDLAEQASLMNGKLNMLTLQLPNLLAAATRQGVEDQLAIADALAKVSMHLADAEERAILRYAADSELPRWLRWLVQVFRDRAFRRRR